MYEDLCIVQLGSVGTGVEVPGEVKVLCKNLGFLGV